MNLIYLELCWLALDSCVHHVLAYHLLALTIIIFITVRQCFMTFLPLVIIFLGVELTILLSFQF